MRKKELNIVLLLPLTFIASCSNLESFDAKMGRYKSQDVESNKVPQLAAIEFSNTNRTIASVEEKNVPTEKSPDEQKNTTTNKKLYFQNLYEQYADLSAFLPEKENPKIEYCPQYHGNFLELKTQKKETANNYNYVFTYDKTYYNDQNYLAKHPELLLPVTEEEALPRAIDILNQSPKLSTSEQSDIVKNALALHLKRTYKELRELCEYGVSQNYYIFENLLTHTKNSSIESNTNGVKILLKTTVFSNIALKTSLDQFKLASIPAGRFPASSSNKSEAINENEIMKRLNVTWMKDYFHKMKE